jgi:hypothetical protein
VGPVHPCGNKLLFHCLKRAIVSLLAIVDLFLFITIFLKYLGFLFMIICLIFMQSLNPSQHGFRKSNSTTTNLVTYLNSIMPSVSTQGHTVPVYFDLSNAFDIVPHNILLPKSFFFLLVMLTGSIAIELVEIFCSYFWNPFVLLSRQVWNASSFHIRPLIFNIFINDIGDSICNFKYLLYADDLKIYRSIRNVDHCKRL